MRHRYEHRHVWNAAEPPFGAYAPRGLQAALIALARVPPLHRGFVRRPLANLVRSLGRDRTVDIERDGLTFRLRGAANLIEDGVLLHPAYNRREIDFLAGALPPGGTFVDLGANIGLYTLPLARKAGPAGRVLAVDANEDIVPVLDFNVRSAGLANVAIACVAVSDHAGRVSLDIRHGDLAVVGVEESPQGEVEMRPLGDVVRDHALERIDALKADIEGYEDRALLPFLRDASPEFHPRRIVIEHLGRHGWKTDCFPVFERHGYRFVGKTRGNSLFERRAA